MTASREGRGLAAKKRKGLTAGRSKAVAVRACDRSCGFDFRCGFDFSRTSWPLGHHESTGRLGPARAGPTGDADSQVIQTHVRLRQMASIHSQGSQL